MAMSKVMQYLTIIVLVLVMAAISYYILQDTYLNIADCQNDLNSYGVSCNVTGGYYAYSFNKTLAKTYHSCCFTDATA